MSANLNLSIIKGSVFTKTVYVKDADKNPVDLTGYTAKMQVRKGTELAIELSTANARIDIVPLEGKVTLSINSADTRAITVKGIAQYDLDLIDATSESNTVLSGVVNFIEEVTV